MLSPDMTGRFLRWLTDPTYADDLMDRDWKTQVAAKYSDAQLEPVRRDIYEILDKCPDEVAGVSEALSWGQISGNDYFGPCCCLLGTIAKLTGVEPWDIDGVAADSNRPAERWFKLIRPGMIPESNPVAAITARWLDEWQAQRAQPVANPTTTPNGV